MRITPLDIEKHRFRRALRGYDAREVHAFLASFAEQYELVIRENHELREDVALLQERLREHDERERVLKDTLLVAQEAAQDLRRTAAREAEVVVKEAELKAERMMDVARERTAAQEARRVELRSVKRELLEQVRGMLRRQGDLLSEWEESDRGEVVPFVEQARPEAGHDHG